MAGFRIDEFEKQKCDENEDQCPYETCVNEDSSMDCAHERDFQSTWDDQNTEFSGPFQNTSHFSANNSVISLNESKTSQCERDSGIYVDSDLDTSLIENGVNETQYAISNVSSNSRSEYLSCSSDMAPEPEYNSFSKFKNCNLVRTGICALLFIIFFMWGITLLLSLILKRKI